MLSSELKKTAAFSANDILDWLPLEKAYLKILKFTRIL